ncbi:hypothetical protein [Salisediminibacterium selenitireducens]|uniref:Uncharacterized protein n=1 Tax=Bacillus selenitireducens (strain ATCC 700615 / DSM 15326 / MLS10) TaxID=439292 RepID=D6XSV9_BACIE|nr:hypothetical protein [Salisediminibacterium selenitireducens]ADH98895.1 hypothetical protein Bsel_1383 [[Bacillus] selenitireducens MLS10]
MYEVTEVTYVNEEGPLVFTVMFHVNGEPTVFATDVLYSVNRKQWLANPFITHDLQALMNFGPCAICKETQVACHPLIQEHKDVKSGILNHDTFVRLASERFEARGVGFGVRELMIETDKAVWDRIIEENRQATDGA